MIKEQRMTKDQKRAYVDAVIYLLQYAQAMESNDIMSKFCLDITKKAEFLYNLKPHLFNARLRKNLQRRIDIYTGDERFFRKTYNEYDGQLPDWQ
jgi:hypothetical protein